jgi:arylsulfatase A-like enzyme
MDSARAKSFSLYGHYRPTTPCLEQIAQEAAVYRYCFSTAPWTVPSHVSLFTGLYPHEHLCNSPFSGLPEDILSLPEILGNLGYHTLGISSNHLVSRTLDFHRGFSEFYEMDSFFQGRNYLQVKNQYRRAKRKLRGDWDKIKFVLKYLLSQDLSYPFKKVVDRFYRKYLADTLKSSAFMTRRSFNLAQRLIDRYKKSGSPFFLFMNLMETHRAYNAPYPFNKKFQKVNPDLGKKLRNSSQTYKVHLKSKAERGEFQSLLYDQEIAFTDHLVGEFYNFLRKQHFLDRLVLIITSDHGESMGEHGVFGHDFSVYNELLHIPLIVKYSRDYGIKGDFSQLVQLNDLFATICQMADSPWPVPLSSKSLLSETRDFALGEFLDNSIGIDFIRRRCTDFKIHSWMLPGRAWIAADFWKLIYWDDGTRELYNLNEDLFEEKNLIGNPQLFAKAKALQEQLETFLNSGEYPD